MKYKHGWWWAQYKDFDPIIVFLDVRGTIHEDDGDQLSIGDPDYEKYELIYRVEYDWTKPHEPITQAD